MHGANRPETLLLLFVLAFAPLAFGAVEAWARAIAGAAALAGLALALQRRTHAGRLRVVAVPGATPLLLWLALLALQLLPLPPALLRAVSPAAHARWEAALGPAGPLPWLPLTLTPLETLRELVRLGSCAALYALTVQLLARRERLRAVTTTVVVLAGALAFEALLQHLLAPQRLLFLRVPREGHAFGPFVNRNHYANLMAMLVPVALGFFLGQPAGAAPGGLRARAAALLARPEASARLLAGFAALLAAASLVLSLSRGATVAVSAALLVFGGCLLAQRLGRRRLVAGALLAYAFAIFVGWFGWEKVGERFAGLRRNPEVVDAVRAGLWRDTLRMARDFPALGAGAGSFERLYPAYRTVPGPFGIAHPHNDHLELLAGTGAAGLALFAAFVASALLAVARACRRRRDPPALYLAWGALAGCVAFLVHGASDFSLAIGANALYFHFLLGLAVSSAHTLGRDDERETLLERRRLPAAATRAAAALAAAGALWLAADLAAAHAWRLAGEGARRGAGLGPASAGTRRLLRQASFLQPLEPAFPAALARAAARAGEAADALRLTLAAVRRAPLDPGTLVQLAGVLGARGDEAGARRAFAAAIAADPSAAAHREAFGAWLLARGDRDAAATRLREALERDPGRTPRVVALLALAGFDDGRIAALVPSVPEGLRHLWRYAEATGNEALAAEVRRRLAEAPPPVPRAR